MHPDHLAAMAAERQSRLLAQAEHQRLVNEFRSTTRGRARAPRTRPFAALLTFIRRDRRKRVGYNAAVPLADDRPIHSAVVPLWMWREESARAWIAGAGRGRTGPERM